MLKTIHSQQSSLIREALKGIREKAGISQRELSRRLNREHTFISKCELGERRVDIAEFYWICKTCDGSPKNEIEKLVKAFDKLK